MQEKLLWNILSLWGINFNGTIPGIYGKLAKIIFIAIFHLSLLNITLCSIFSTIKEKTSIKACITYFLVTFHCFVMWSILFIRQKNIRNNLIQLQKYRTYFNITINKYFVFLINVISFIILLMTWGISVLPYTIGIVPANMSHWTYGRTFYGSRTISILMDVAYQIDTFCFPLIVSLSLSIVFYRWAELLCYYNKSLNQILSANICPENLDTLKVYFHLLKHLRTLNQVISSLSLLVISLSFEFIFIVMIDFTAVKGEKYYEIIPNFICGLGVFIFFTVSASSIPDNQKIIRITAGELIQEVSSSKSETKFLFLLKRIEDMPLVQICPFGMFNVTKSFILSAVGTIFTYELLLVNLNM